MHHQTSLQLVRPSVSREFNSSSACAMSSRCIFINQNAANNSTVSLFSLFLFQLCNWVSFLENFLIQKSFNLDMLSQQKTIFSKIFLQIVRVKKTAKFGQSTRKSVVVFVLSIAHYWQFACKRYCFIITGDKANQLAILMTN